MRCTEPCLAAAGGAGAHVLSDCFSSFVFACVSSPREKSNTSSLNSCERMDWASRKSGQRLCAASGVRARSLARTFRMCMQFSQSVSELLAAATRSGTKEGQRCGHSCFSTATRMVFSLLIYDLSLRKMASSLEFWTGDRGERGRARARGCGVACLYHDSGDVVLDAFPLFGGQRHPAVLDHTLKYLRRGERDRRQQDSSSEREWGSSAWPLLAALARAAATRGRRRGAGQQQKSRAERWASSASPPALRAYSLLRVSTGAPCSPSALSG